MDWSREKGITVLWNGRRYALAKTEEGYRASWERNGTHSRDYAAALARPYYAAMLPTEFYTDLLGLEVEASGARIDVRSGAAAETADH